MDWSEMLPEILEIIAKKHKVFSYEGYMSFAGVCKSWHSAAIRVANKGHYPNGLPSRFPTLLLADKKEEYVRQKFFPFKKNIFKLRNRFPCLMRAEEKEDDVRELFCLSNKSIRKIRLPEASGKLCVSSCGWLLTVGDNFRSKLIHPFSREIINLPKIYTFPKFGGTSEWSNGVQKLIFLIPSSLVIVLWGCSRKLGFCRAGDNKWTAVINGQAGMIFDITYHKGLIYSFCCNYHIQACDVSAKDPTFITVSTLPREFYYEWLGGAYIVGLEDNGLLVVIREGMYDNIEDDPLIEENYKTKSFRVFKYDLDSNEWSEVKDLGTKALFVGYSQSFWMEEDTSGEIKGNCIYYTDDVFELYAGSIKGGGRDMGVYHMSNGNIEPHFYGESRSHFSPPMWLQPV